MDKIQSIQKEEKKLKKFFFGRVADNYDKFFLAILGIALLIRLWIFTKTLNQPVWWDGADYLSAAIRWAGINPNLIDMWYYRRGMFWPLFETFFFKFGPGEIGIRLANVFFSTGIIFVSYAIIKDMFDKKTAILVSICLSFSWIFLFFTGRILNNLPGAFFLLMSLMFFWKGYVMKNGNKYIYLFGLFFAITCLTRMQYLISAIPLVIFAFTRERHRFLYNKHLWIAVGIFALMFIPQFYMHYQHFGNPITDLSKYYLGVGNSEKGEVGVKLAKTSDLFLYFSNLPYILDANQKGYYTIFAFSPLYLMFVIGLFFFFLDTILGIDRIFKDGEIQKRFFVLIWIAVSFLFLGYIAPQLEQRYIMDDLPFLFLIAVYPYNLMEKHLIKRFNMKTRTIFLLVCLFLFLILIPNIIFGNTLIESKKTSYLEVKEAGLWIKENSNPSDVVISDSLPQITYYSQRSTYPFNLAPRRDMERKNESALLEFIKTDKPKFMTLTAFERQDDWAMTLPQKYPEMIVPVKAYKQNEQPVFIIYEFKY